MQGKIPELFYYFLASQTVKIEVENRTSCFLGKSGVYMGVAVLVMEVDWDFFFAFLRKCAIININKRHSVQTNIANVGSNEFEETRGTLVKRESLFLIFGFSIFFGFFSKISFKFANLRAHASCSPNRTNNKNSIKITCKNSITYSTR